VPDEKPKERAVHRPTVNVAGALGEAGHEVEDLGVADVPDSGSLCDEPAAASDQDAVINALDASVQGLPKDC
jgi:hypothetical protein